MLHRILSASRIKSVAVSEERLSSEFPDDIGNSPDIVGSEIRAVTKLSEMHLDGNELAVEIDVGNSCRLDEFLQFGTLADAYGCSEIGKIHFGFFHKSSVNPPLGQK